MTNIVKDKLNIIVDAIVIVFADTKYLMFALLLALFMAITYPLLFPLAIGIKKISIFVFRASITDVVILTLISILFGIIFAMQCYKIKKLSKDYKGTGANIISSLIGFASSKACCILPLILFTIGATASIPFLIKYTTEIRLIGLTILFISFYWTSKDIVNGSCCTTQKT